ncbi:MAG: hypothetical protein ACE1YX_04275 [Nitrosopumilaceae archaeon]|nr:MAG: conserved hypothetical protein [Marine Group I thaumarchaeote]
MISKGVAIGFGSGAVAAAVLGLFFGSLVDKSTSLEFIEGPSLSIIIEKTDFELGQPIHIRIVNSGTEPLTFSDSSYGFKIVGLDGTVLYSPLAAQVISVLKPRGEATFVWDQTKTNGDNVIAGRYKIISSTMGEDVLKDSVIINIFK